MKHIGAAKDRLPIFKDRLRELQGARSNTEFAEFLGISRQTIGFYLNGDRIPDALVLLQIAERCRVSADWLLGLSKARTNDASIAQICEYTGLCPAAVTELHQTLIEDAEISPLLAFMNEILTSRDLAHFKKAAFFDAALRISHSKSKAGNPLSDISDDIADTLRQVQIDKEAREAQIVSGLLTNGETDGLIQISTNEAALLYERIALAALEVFYSDAIFGIEENYKQT